MSSPFDFERCWHALSGQATQHQDPSTRAGRLMRRLMLERQAHAQAHLSAPIAKANPSEASNEALMARLRAAGAFAGRPAQTGLGQRLAGLVRGGLPAWLSLPAAATGMLSLAGVAALFIQLRPAAPPFDDGQQVMRGAEQAQRLQVADPVGFANELQALLQTQQLLVRRVDSASSAGAVVQLQAKLPDDAQPLRQALLARGVVVEAHGRLSLVIERWPEQAR